MVNIAVSLVLVITLFFFGQVMQSIQRFLKVLVTIIFKLLSLLGIRIRVKEKELKLDEEFKQTYAEISKVNISKKNLKDRDSINWFGVAEVLVALILIVVNMKFATNYAISNWIYSWFSGLNIIDAVTVNTFYTAVLFSIVSFGVSSILAQWKETKQHRQEKREIKLKLKALAVMESKELLDEARKKDEQNLKELK